MKFADFKEVFIRPGHNVAALDGIRALAILLIIGAHINGIYIGLPEAKTTILSSIPPFKGGWIGVPLFFCLSGYLIGGQIWDEYLKTNRVKFWRFFFRRGFRIWPLYYFILIVFALFSLNGGHELRGLISNSLFLSNYWFDAGPIHGAWSLSTEEQFYIITPLVMLGLSKFFGKKDLKFYRRILYIVFFLPIIFRYFTWMLVSPNGEFDLSLYMLKIYRPIHTHCEGLIGGLIISNIVRDKDFKFSFYDKYPYALLIISFGLMFLSFNNKVYFNFLGVGIGFTTLLWVVLKKNLLISRFFGNKIFFPIAKTSFGTYLIHLPIINYLFDNNVCNFLNFEPTYTLLFACVVVVISSVLICSLLYVFIEKPFIMWRRKFLKNF